MELVRCIFLAWAWKFFRQGTQRTCGQGFYVLKDPSNSTGFKQVNLGSRDEHDIDHQARQINSIKTTKNQITLLSKKKKKKKKNGISQIYQWSTESNIDHRKIALADIAVCLIYLHKWMWQILPRRGHELGSLAFCQWATQAQVLSHARLSLFVSSPGSTECYCMPTS